MKRISIILGAPHAQPVGGYELIYTYANALVARGHSVTIYYESSVAGATIPHAPTIMRHALGRARVARGVRWFSLNPAIRQQAIFGITDDTVSDADVVIATAVRTANGVAALSPRKGKKYYFIQGFETWAMPEPLVRGTYNLGMTNIVIASWLKDIVDTESHESAILIPNGIDLDTFRCSVPPVQRDRSSVAVMYHPEVHKGFSDAYEALLIAKRAVPDLHINAFGAYKKPAHLPEWFSYTESATPSQLTSIYNHSATYVCASKNDGFGLTGLESMACGCALVSTSYIGVHEYANEACALLSPIGEPNKLADHLISAITNDATRVRIACAGITRAKDFDLSQSSKLFCEVIAG